MAKGVEYERTPKGEPITDEAREWQGWGTALKPALEPIVLARKPLIGTVVENVLKHGTGAIYIDGCRVEADDQESLSANWDRETITDIRGGNFMAGKPGALPCTSKPGNGRWPANVIHDGSEEVLQAFPDCDGAVSSGRKGVQGVYQDGIGAAVQMPSFGDSGSAARFFYSAKADSEDRIGSKHPTVKPIDLMQWLIRLTTPKGGLVLDPFAGTGTTGEAAYREGVGALLIEREASYFADIERRLKLMKCGPGTRARESLKASGKVLSAGPLFGTQEASGGGSNTATGPAEPNSSWADHRTNRNAEIAR